MNEENEEMDLRREIKHLTDRLNSASKSRIVDAAFVAWRLSVAENELDCLLRKRRKESVTGLKKWLTV